MGENPPASIPLWSFNEKTGLWEEEGSAALQGNVYVGEVAHFSWVNLDWPENQGTVYGYVKDDTGKDLPGVRLNIGQLQTPTVTQSNGYYEHEVPANTAFSITVKDLYYGGINQKVSVKVPALSPGERRQVDITLPHLVRVYGKVVNEQGYGIRSSVWVQTEKDKTEALQTDKLGNFNVYVPKDMKGNATVYARTYRGDEATEDITIKDEDINVKLTVSGTGGINTNMIHILSDVLGDEAWPIPTYTSPISGVVILDDAMMLIPEEKANILMSIIVPHYDKEKTTYTENVTAYVSNQAEKREFRTMPDKEMKCTVQRNGNDFVFSLEGDGFFGKVYSGDDGDDDPDSEKKYDENAQLVGKMMNYQLLAAAKTLRNIMPVDAGFPSFTPQLAEKAPFALLITESLRLGKGGVVYYNGGSSAYNNLKNAAAKLGLTNMGEDNEDGYLSVTFYSAKKKIMIMLEYDPEAKGVTDKNTFKDVSECAPICMNILEGISEDTFRDMMEEGDDDTRSTRVAARKHFNPISKCKFDGFKKKKIFKKLARLR